MLSDLVESQVVLSKMLTLLLCLCDLLTYEMKEPVEIGGKEYNPDDLVIVKVEKNSDMANA